MLEPYLLRIITACGISGIGVASKLLSYIAADEKSLKMSHLVNLFKFAGLYKGIMSHSLLHVTFVFYKIVCSQEIPRKLTKGTEIITVFHLSFIYESHTIIKETN